jgi:hypothetical protein
MKNTGGIVRTCTRKAQRREQIFFSAAGRFIRSAFEQLSTNNRCRDWNAVSKNKMNKAGFSKLDTIGHQKYFDSD